MTKSSLKPLYPASSDLLSGCEPCGAFPLDSTITGMVAAAEMLGDPAPQRFVDSRWAMASALIFAGLFAMAGRAYAADPDAASYVRHLAISEGVVKPPRRSTADERAKAEAKRWGLDRKEVVR